ncbi:MAG: LysR family transcriptional regulator [Rhizobiales bacterium]|nr:LysR family transcriptional regulator [Hyphomicrobiales bacterium]
MDTRFLESFVTVVDKGSIAEAARRLHLTPAAVAQRLRALESEIGKPLVSRAGRTVKPTETGIAMLERARLLLRHVRDLKATSADGVLIGELRLGATATALTGMMPAILSSLAAAHPQIEIYIVPGVSVELYHQVVSGDLDAAIIVQPPFAIPKACDWQTLNEEPLVVLTPAGMPAQTPHRILATQPFIRYDRNHWGGQIVDRYLRQARIHPQERFELDALDAIAAMVDRGLGVSLVPDWAPPWPEGLSLARLPVPEPGWGRRVGLFWGHMSPRAGLVRALRENAAAVMRR